MQKRAEQESYEQEREIKLVKINMILMEWLVLLLDFRNMNTKRRTNNNEKIKNKSREKKSENKKQLYSIYL